MKRVALGCLALAALSLLLPSAPSYDPMAWLVWGREIAHLDLSTAGGPSWKPLPVVFTTLFAPAGSAAPWLWLAVARAGALLGLVFAYRVAARLAGSPVAGVLAAAALVLSRGWLWSSWIGYSEGLLIGLLLCAVDRHLDGRHRQALALGFLASLLRPEVWPFAGLYALWLCRREPALRRRALLGAAGVVALWLVPDLLGSGDPLRGAGRAREPTPGSKVPALAHHPALALLSSATTALVLPALVGFGLALARRRPRPGLERVTTVLALVVLAWVVLVAVMTQEGYSGNPRYLIGPAGVACVVAGVGWTELGRSVLARAGIAPRLVAPLALALVVALSLPWTYPRASALRAPAPGVRHEAELQRTLPTVIHLAGGRDRVLACGRPVTHLYAVPRLAWALRVHLGRVGFVAADGAVVQARRGPGAPWLPVADAGYREVARTRLWRIVTPCAASSETASATTATPPANTRNVGSSPSVGTASPAATAGTEIDR